MASHYDYYKNFLETSYSFNWYESDLPSKLIGLSKLEAESGFLADSISSRFKTVDEFLEFLEELKAKKDDDYAAWLARFMVSERETLTANLLSLESLMKDFGKESIVRVENGPKLAISPLPETITSPKQAALSEDDVRASEVAQKPPAREDYNSDVTCKFDAGELEFVSHKTGFTVYHASENKRDLIVNRDGGNYEAVTSRMFEPDYVAQVAEIVVKNSLPDDVFTITVPESLQQNGTPKQQAKFVRDFKAALVAAGAPQNKITVEGLDESSPEVKNGDDSIKSKTQKNSDAAPFHHAAIKQDTPLQRRFTKYLDQDNKRKGKNPWINFIRLSGGEGARVLEMIKAGDSKPWSANATAHEKVKAINEFIKATCDGDAQEYFGVHAKVTPSGDVGFVPDTDPFPMEHVYQLAITPNQFNALAKFVYTDESIKGLVDSIGPNLAEQRADAQRSISSEYDKQASEMVYGDVMGPHQQQQVEELEQANYMSEEEAQSYDMYDQDYRGGEDYRNDDGFDEVHDFEQNDVLSEPAEEAGPIAEVATFKKDTATLAQPSV